jgi:hypothetical protein
VTFLLIINVLLFVLLIFKFCWVNICVIKLIVLLSLD